MYPEIAGNTMIFQQISCKVTLKPFDDPVYLDYLLYNVRHVLEGDGVRAVAQGLVRVRVDLHEEAVRPAGGRGPREIPCHFPVPAGACAHASGGLDAVGGGKDNGEPEGLHDRYGPEVNDQVVVPEGHP